jgi:glycosyltransferase involved in cell wall biosynthesis
MKKDSLTIVLPCYNPEKNWVKNILVRLEELSILLANYDLEIVIVNDGSTLDIVADLSKLSSQIRNCSIISYPTNRGKGYAIRQGVESAKSNYILYTDIDFPYTNESILKIVDQLLNNDIAIGIRGLSYYENIPFHRALISKLLKFFIKLLLRIPTNDTQGGLKGMRKEVKQYFLKTEIDRYLFDLEFICIAAKNNLQISLIPVVLNETTVVRKMNLNVISKEAFNFFKIFVRM